MRRAHRKLRLATNSSGASAVPRISGSPQKISKTGIDDDEAGKDQGDGKPGLCLRTTGGLGAMGWRTLEGGDVARHLSDRMSLDIGRCAGTAHLLIIAFVDEMDGGFRCLRLGHFLQKRLVAIEERLRLRGQRGG